MPLGSGVVAAGLSGTPINYDKQALDSVLETGTTVVVVSSAAAGATEAQVLAAISGTPTAVTFGTDTGGSGAAEVDQSSAIVTVPNVVAGTYTWEVILDNATLASASCKAYGLLTTPVTLSATGSIQFASGLLTNSLR